MAITDKKEDDGSTIWVSSLVSQKTGEGVVEFTWGDKKAQLSPNEARTHAQGIFECAEAADTDAFLVEFLQSIGTEKNNAIKILIEFRSFRETRLKDKHH